jgi:hypothetical protein
MSFGPRERYSKQGQGQDRPFQLADYQLSFDKEAIMTMIGNHGIRVTHYRSILDPAGVSIPGSVQDSNGNRESSDGYVYEIAGVCSPLFTANSTQTDAKAFGLTSYSTAYLTFPEKYDDSDEPIIIAPWDRFFFKDIEVRVVATQLVEANSNGIDRLQFPATFVEHIVDSARVTYTLGMEYEITDEGNIKWLTQKRPGWNANLNRGTTYSIRYRYTPFFVAAHLIHEIRVIQVTDAMGDRNVERMPYQVLAYRENVLRDMNAGDPNKPLGYDGLDRFQTTPQTGGRLVKP